MAMQTSTLCFGIVWFTLWTVLSFYAHYFARQTIRSGATLDEKLGLWLTTLILTFVQLLVGSIVLRIFTAFLSRGFLPFLTEGTPQLTKTDYATETKQPEPCTLSLYLSHAAATLATNASIAFVNTGSAFTIKAFEPISTAVLSSMLLGTKLQNHLIIALPLVVSGAVGFIWRPSFHNGATFGLGMAFVSNILFGVRNINLKIFHQKNVTITSKVQLLTSMSIIAALSLLPLIIALEVISPLQKFKVTSSLISASFHITYTIISTCVILKYTSTVGHATCNLLKRILVAAMFYLIGKDIISSSNWLMGGVLLLGLAIYAFPAYFPLREVNSSLSLVGVIIAVTLLTACMPPSLNSSTDKTALSDGRVNLPALDLQTIRASRLNSLQQDFNMEYLDQPINAHEEPEKANLQSIKAETTNDLITEAYKVHQQVFTHIIGRYKRAVLVNVFQWFNKGDHLITIGQRRILQRIGIELIYHCYYPGRDCNFDAIDKADSDLVILIQGAGYIGHPAHQYVVTNTLQHFPNNRIMVFPISVCHPIEPCTEIQQFADIFSKHTDVHIVLRDRYSYDLSEQYFKNTYNYLAPDSAFAVGSIRMNIVPIYDIVWLKRDDWESQGDKMPTFPERLKVQVTDWSDEWMKQTVEDFWEDHQLRTMTGIAFLARAKVVISDRLHAHIMSQLMGKLNVVINSETKKQEHYYMTWEQSIKTSALVNNNTEALQEALRLLTLYEETVTLV